MSWLKAYLICITTMLPATLFAQDGRALFMDPSKGRCNLCHQVPADAAIKSLSTIGPPLANMKERFASLEALDAVIGNNDKGKPDSFMPPFRKHRLLTDAEISAIARYVWSL